MSELQESPSSRRHLPAVALLILVALALRALAAADYGYDWYGRGELTLVNFDEAGSCRAALGGFDYPRFVGWQTLAVASWLGDAPQGVYGDAAAAKAWCQGDGHLRVARAYSVIAGSATAAALWWLAILLFPRRPAVATLAAALLALSGWHISESMVGTVDAASTFFIYLFLASAVLARRRGGLSWLLAALCLVPALITKLWVFALFALAALVPRAMLRDLGRGIGKHRALALLLALSALAGIVSNPQAPPFLRILLPPLLYLITPWPSLSPLARGLLLLLPWLPTLALQWDPVVAMTTGSLEGRFGTDYGAIGWNKPLRNLLNPPIVLVMGLGAPAAFFALRGAWRLWTRSEPERAWLALLPLAAFGLFLLFLMPVTYYRHYLPLLPAFCLLAALGLDALRGPRRHAAIALVLLWQSALAWDLVSDYHLDPRRELPAWYAREQPRGVLITYYVNPPPGAAARHGLLQPRRLGLQAPLPAGVDTLILSENWYDTAFANELNGPRVKHLDRLIKTTPLATRFYRQALAGDDPRLRTVAHFAAPAFMPELRLHKHFYGSFTQFVGDIVILRKRS